MRRKPTVLVLCEFSGVVRDAFARRGWNAWSCDLLSSDAGGQHIQGDALKVLDGTLTGRWPKKWDLVIAHPPCTFIANSGAKHLYIGMNKRNGPCPVRWREMRKGAQFFKKLLTSNVKFIAVENPVMLGYAQDIIGVGPSQVTQPWMFGHLEVKATCFWLRNLPLLQPTNNVREATYALTYAERAKVHWCPPGPDRWKFRSTTYVGLANAMAAQWGDYVWQQLQNT